MKKAKAGPRERPRQVQLQLTIPGVTPPGIRKIKCPKKSRVPRLTCPRMTMAFYDIHQKHRDRHHEKSYRSEARE